MPKLANINEVISNAMLMRLPAFLGIRDKEFCALLGYAPVWLSRIKKDIDSGKKKPDDAVVTFLDKTISEYVEASPFIEEQAGVTWQLIDLFISIYIKKHGIPKNIGELLSNSRILKTIQDLYISEDRTSEQQAEISELVKAIVHIISEQFGKESIPVDIDFDSVAEFDNFSDMIFLEGYTPEQFLEDPYNEKYAKFMEYTKKNNLSLNRYNAYLKTSSYQHYISVKNQKAEKIASMLKEQGLNLKSLLIMSEMDKK